MSHHLHIDFDDQGHAVVTCLRCQQSGHGVIPAEPCPHPEVAVACCAEDSGIVIEVGDDS